MSNISNADKKATITLMCLMLAVDNIDELRQHPTYRNVFKGQLKVGIKTTILHYDRMLNEMLKATDGGVDITDSYVEFCKGVDELFNFEKRKDANS
jgi:hypothetical protein